MLLYFALGIFDGDVVQSTFILCRYEVASPVLAQLPKPLCKGLKFKRNSQARS